MPVNYAITNTHPDRISVAFGSVGIALEVLSSQWQPERITWGRSRRRAGAHEDRLVVNFFDNTVWAYRIGPQGAGVCCMVGRNREPSLRDDYRAHDASSHYGRLIGVTDPTVSEDRV